MVLYQFQQAGNEEFQSRKKIGKSKLPDAGRKMQGIVGNGTVAVGSNIGEWRISLWHSEIFAIPAKFSLCHNFSMMEKFLQTHF